MHDVTVIDDPAAAEASLDPIRTRLLAVAVAGRMVREVGELITGVVVLGDKAVDGIHQLDGERGPVLRGREPHLAVDPEGCERLTATLAQAAPGGRPHRFVVALHPTITKSQEPRS